jgi:hypothetical protein
MNRILYTKIFGSAVDVNPYADINPGSDHSVRLIACSFAVENLGAGAIRPCVILARDVVGETQIRVEGAAITAANTVVCTAGINLGERASPCVTGDVSQIDLPDIQFKAPLRVYIGSATAAANFQVSAAGLWYEIRES